MSAPAMHDRFAPDDEMLEGELEDLSGEYYREVPERTPRQEERADPTPDPGGRDISVQDPRHEDNAVSHPATVRDEPAEDDRDDTDAAEEPARGVTTRVGENAGSRPEPATAGPAEDYRDGTYAVKEPARGVTHREDKNVGSHPAPVRDGLAEEDRDSTDAAEEPVRGDTSGVSKNDGPRPATASAGSMENDRDGTYAVKEPARGVTPREDKNAGSHPAPVTAGPAEDISEGMETAEPVRGVTTGIGENAGPRPATASAGSAEFDRDGTDAGEEESGDPSGDEVGTVPRPAPIHDGPASGSDAPPAHVGPADGDGDSGGDAGETEEKNDPAPPKGKAGPAEGVARDLVRGDPHRKDDSAGSRPEPVHDGSAAAEYGGADGAADDPSVTPRILYERQAAAERGQLRADARRDFSYTWMKLAGARADGSPVDCVIARVTKQSLGKATEVIIEAVVDNNVYVQIPYDEFFSRDMTPKHDDLDLSNPVDRATFTSRKIASVRRFAGCTVPVCINDMISGNGDSKAPSMDNYAVLASRRRALEREIHHYFIPGENREAIVQEGDVVAADILTTNIRTVFLNVRGVDLSVSLNTLTYKYIKDARYEYDIGDKLPVVIRDVNMDLEKSMRYHKKDPVVTLDVSCRPLERLRVPQVASRMCFDDVVRGQVTAIFRNRRTNRMQIYIWIPEYGIPGVVVEFDQTSLQYHGHQPRVGMNVLVKVGIHGTHDQTVIIGKDREDGKTGGILFTRLHRLM